MKKLLVIPALLVAMQVSAQEKKHIVDAQTLLKMITPNDKLDGWILAHNLDGDHKILKSSGYTDNFDRQNQGFKFSDSDPGYYYIAYSNSGIWKYVRNMDDLRKFVGTVDNAEEAGIEAMSQGYFFDTEYKDYSSNYRQDDKNFYFEAAKVTSSACPYAKSNFALTVDKKTGAIIDEKDLGVYSKIYDKTCENNPRHTALQDQMDAAQKQREEEAAKIKADNEKMRKKLRATMLKNSRRN